MSHSASCGRDGAADSLGTAGAASFHHPLCICRSIYYPSVTASVIWTRSARRKALVEFRSASLWDANAAGLAHSTHLTQLLPGNMMPGSKASWLFLLLSSLVLSTVPAVKSQVRASISHKFMPD